MEIPEAYKELKPFLNEQMQLTALPVKRRKKRLALYYLATKFAPGRTYTESEVNGLLNGWHTFFDPATVRRELYNNRLLERSPDGRSYWQEAPLIALDAFLEG